MLLLRFRLQQASFSVSCSFPLSNAAQRGEWGRQLHQSHRGYTRSMTLNFTWMTCDSSWISAKPCALCAPRVSISLNSSRESMEVWKIKLAVFLLNVRLKRLRGTLIGKTSIHSSNSSDVTEKIVAKIHLGLLDSCIKVSYRNLFFRQTNVHFNIFWPLQDLSNEFFLFKFKIRKFFKNFIFRYISQFLFEAITFELDTLQAF